MADFYTVLEFNQACRRPDPDQQLTLFDNPEDAFELADDMARENRDCGRRETFRVYGLFEVDRQEVSGDGMA